MDEFAVPNEAILQGPRVNWNHVDGPLLAWAGLSHWLTLRERLLLALRLTTVERIACRRWPDLNRQYRTLRNSMIIDACLCD